MPETAPTLFARRLLVSGKVQGVFYRKYTHRKGQELGVTGWVRNLPDGRVEIEAEGTAAQLDALQQWCHTGSPKARVTGVAAAPDRPLAEATEEEEVETRRYSSFDIVR